jgi:hypothetical protein
MVLTITVIPGLTRYVGPRDPGSLKATKLLDPGGPVEDVRPDPVFRASPHRDKVTVTLICIMGLEALQSENKSSAAIQ